MMEFFLCVCAVLWRRGYEGVRLCHVWLAHAYPIKANEGFYIHTMMCILCAFMWKICPCTISTMDEAHLASRSRLNLLRICQCYAFKDKRYNFSLSLEMLSMQAHALKINKREWKIHPCKAIINPTATKKICNMSIISTRVWTGWPYFTAD